MGGLGRTSRADKKDCVFRNMKTVAHTTQFFITGFKCKVETKKTAQRRFKTMALLFYVSSARKRGLDDHD